MQYRKHVLALAAAALVAACGGGSDSPTALAQQAATALRSAPMRAAPLRAGLSADAAAEALLDAAEASAEYHQYFPSHQATQSFAPFKFRYYPETGIYLGVAVTAGMGYEQYHVYVAGGSFGTLASPFDAGPLSQYGITVDTGGSTGGGGTANGCFDLNLADTEGTHIVVNYSFSGIVTGAQTVDTTVGAMSTFEGHPARKTTVVTTGSQGGSDINTTGTNYSLRTGDNVTEYGGDFVSSYSYSGTTTTTTVRTVYNPPFLDQAYTLAPGQSITQQQSATATTTMHYSIPGAPDQVNTTSYNSSNTIKYVSQEQVTVPAGTFAACKYEYSSPGATDLTTSWYVVGKGVAVKTESVIPGYGTMTMQATSATINGAPL